MHFYAIWIVGLVCLFGVAYSNSVVKVPNNPPSVSIVGGVPALRGEFPSMTAIFVNGAFICGGTLLGPFHVLTASHCFAGVSAASALTVKVNTLTLNGSTGFIQRPVKKFIVHPSFNSSTIDNDVAVMVLKSPITNSKFYVNLPIDRTTLKPAATTTATTPKPGKPAATTKVPSCPYPCAITKPVIIRKTTKKPASFNSYANQLAVVAGWGKTSSGGVISQTLLKTNVTIQDNAICANQYPTKFVGGNQLCAFAPGKNTCNSDSGGPIFLQGVQVGIISYGNGCADPNNFAGVYARVTTYLDWIKTTMTNNPGLVSG